LNRRELIAAMAEKIGCTKVLANKNLEGVIEIITSTLEDGNVVHISGLGTFKVGLRSARIVRHPRTGENIKVKGAKRLIFIPSVELSKHLSDTD
jgi:DNA-binding protein HU-beta